MLIACLPDGSGCLLLNGDFGTPLYWQQLRNPIPSVLKRGWPSETQRRHRRIMAFIEDAAKGAVAYFLALQLCCNAHSMSLFSAARTAITKS
jgi:hypothetical protein